MKKAESKSDAGLFNTANIMFSPEVLAKAKTMLLIAMSLASVWGLQQSPQASQGGGRVSTTGVNGTGEPGSFDHRLTA